MKNKTIKQQIEELNNIIAWFDSDDFELEIAFDKFKEAEALASSIEESLNRMKNNISVIRKSFARPEAD